MTIKIVFLINLKKKYFAALGSIQNSMTVNTKNWGYVEKIYIVFWGFNKKLTITPKYVYTYTKVCQYVETEEKK